MLIDVTQDHINHGRRKCGVGCMVALALKSKFPDREIWVDGHNACVGDAVVWLPNYVFDRISDFDSGREVRPFSFHLEVM